MRKKKLLWAGLGLLLLFVLWTILIQSLDVQAAGPKNTKVGFASWNVWFHHLTGVHMAIYTVTDWGDRSVPVDPEEEAFPGGYGYPSPGNLLSAGSFRLSFL